VAVAGLPDSRARRGRHPEPSARRLTCASSPTYRSPGRAGTLRPAEHSRGG
jgi:hypothetical protein